MMSEPSGRASTIVDQLLHRAAACGSRPAFTLVDLRGRSRTLSYAELLDGALRVATGLRERGLRQGDRLLVCLPTGPELLTVLYGTLLAGGVCVPVYPPQAQKGLRHWKDQVLAMGRLAQPCGGVTYAGARLHLASVLEQLTGDLFTVTPGQLETAGTGTPAVASAADLAFVQFTSGTTRRPRGVSVSHAALMANMSALLQVMPLSEEDISVSWLPPYHDMGLVGHIFMPVLAGVHQLLMPTVGMLRRPESWLELCTSSRATQTTAPNSAFALCARRIGRATHARLDLGALHWVLNGSEPVLPETLEAFGRAFRPQGFRDQAFRPVYGLAEATLTATFSREGGPRVDWVDRAAMERRGLATAVVPSAKAAQAFVAVGTPLPGHEVVVMDEAGPCRARRVGEICLRGPSVMHGYFNDPAATQEVLRDGWLHSGDLGYLDEDGQLHVTGRLKDLIIRNGRKLLPDDVEAAVAGLPWIRPGRAVALGLPSSEEGTESLVLVAEIHDPRRCHDPLLLQRLAQAVAERTGTRPDRVELCEPGRLPKTTSGKLQRSRVKALLEQGHTLAAPPPPPVDRLVESLRSAMDLTSTRIAKLLGWH